MLQQVEFNQIFIEICINLPNLASYVFTETFRRKVGLSITNIYR